MRFIAALAIIALAGSAASADVVINGDFETGALGPSTSAYTQNTVDMIPEATWNIVSFNTLHPSWVDFFDHTQGNADGHYMIVNGTTNNNGPAWGQTVSVAANTDYQLSAWFASLYPTAVAALQFHIVTDSGTIISPTFSAPAALATWAQSGFTFNSGSSTSISVQIWDVNDAFTGNDYAIDDISLTAVPAPGAAALMGFGALAAARRRRAR